MTPDERVDISFFRPHPGAMHTETGIIRQVLLIWAVLAFGVPLLIWLAGLGDPQQLGASWLTGNRWLLGFPLHYWLLAQGCTIGFVLLCKRYCTLWDRRMRPTPPAWSRAGGREE